MLLHQNVARSAVFLFSKRDDSELGGLQNIKGKNFVQATSIAGSVSNYSVQFCSRLM